MYMYTVITSVLIFLTVVCSWRPPDYQSHSVASSPRYQSTVLLATAAVVYWMQEGKREEGREERRERQQ